MDRIKLKCKNCDGTLEVDEEQEVLHCPYCGSSEIIKLADEVAIQKIKSKTEKEIKFKEMDMQAEKEKKADEKEAAKEYKKSKLGKFTIALAVIFFLVALGSFGNTDIILGIIALAQAGLAGASWAMGAKMIKEPKPNMQLISFGVALALMLVWFLGLGISESIDQKKRQKEHEEWLEKNSSYSETTKEVTTEETTEDESTTDAESTTEEETTTKNSNEVTPELKEFLDSYEAFCDEYVAFMKSYDSNDATMMLKYASLMSKYADFADKAEKYDDKDSMSDADYNYYIKTMSRINTKLASAAYSMQ